MLAFALDDSFVLLGFNPRFGAQLWIDGLPQIPSRLVQELTVPAQTSLALTTQPSATHAVPILTVINSAVAPLCTDLIRMKILAGKIEALILGEAWPLGEHASGIKHKTLVFVTYLLLSSASSAEGTDKQEWQAFALYRSPWGKERGEFVR
jgi:hypothetical protein